MEIIERKEVFKLDPTFSPDIKVYGKNGAFREGHRVIVSRLSHLLQSVFKCNEEEEDLALVLPDVPGGVIDLLLELAYSGWVGGLGLNNISQVRDVCQILDMTQSDFVVRSEEKLSSGIRIGLDPSAHTKNGFETTTSSVAPNITNIVEYTTEESDETEAIAEYSNDQLPAQGQERTSSLQSAMKTESRELKDIGQTTDCNMSTKQEAGTSSHKKKENRSKTQGSFQCEHCDKTFIYAKSFERHGEICNASHQHSHNDTSKTENGVLQKRKRRARRQGKFDNSESLSDEEERNRRKPAIVFRFEHYNEVDGEFFCTFPDCQYTQPFKSLENCKNHQLLLHADHTEKIYTCEVCTDKFASLRLRNKHMNLCHRKRFQCYQCNKQFCERTRLVIHMRTHTGEKPFVCDLCGYACTQRNNLRKHKDLRHKAGETSQFVCEVCQATFNTKGNLKRHKQRHEPDKLLPFVCELCGKSFKDKGSLKQHSYSHGSAHYKCHHCKAAFSSPLYLYRHTTRKHPTDGVQPYNCNLCHKGFPLNSQLQIHIQAVHEKLKHSCPNCNQLMARKTSLHRHLKSGRCPGMSNGSQIMSNGTPLVSSSSQLDNMEPVAIQSVLQQLQPHQLQSNSLQHSLQQQNQQHEQQVVLLKPSMLDSSSTTTLILTKSEELQESQLLTEEAPHLHHQQDEITDPLGMTETQAFGGDNVTGPEGGADDSMTVAGGGTTTAEMFSNLPDVSALAAELGGSMRDLVVPATYQVLVSSQPYVMFKNESSN